jgi:hypothetical protein
MRKSRFSEEQIIGVLKEHQAGLPVAENGLVESLIGRLRDECLL